MVKIVLDNDTLACAHASRFATPRDTEARFVWYSDSNQGLDTPDQSTDPNHNQKERSKGIYGYRSLPLLPPKALTTCG